MDQGLKLGSDGHAFADGCVDEIEEPGVWEGGVEVHEFGGVDNTATTNGEEGVSIERPCPVNCLLDSISKLA